MSVYHVIGIMQHAVSDEWRHVNATVRSGSYHAAAISAANAAVADEGLGWVPTLDDFSVHDWNFWLMAVVELVPGLPVRYNGSPTGMKDVSQAAGAASGDTLWVAALDLDSGEVWVQRMYADTLKAVEAAADADGYVRGTYGAVAELADGSFATLDKYGGMQPVIMKPAANPRKRRLLAWA